MNSLAVQDALVKAGVPSCVMSAIAMDEVAEHYTIRGALDRLDRNETVIVAGGTGHPYFTTDTASSLRAIELGADLMLKATRVNGVYTGDPEKDPSAQKIDAISYIDVIQKQLRVLDMTSVSLCMENSLPIIVFNLFESGSMKRIVAGEKIGTIIS
jgi:uridylate kinase